jgi:hypothetical protein
MEHPGGNIVPVPRSMELLRSSNQVVFSKTEKVQKHPGRRAYPQAPLSAIERHKCCWAPKRSTQARYSNILLQVTSMEASAMKHQISTKFCLVLTKHQTISGGVEDVSKFLRSQCSHDGIVLGSVVLFLTKKNKVWPAFSLFSF